MVDKDIQVGDKVQWNYGAGHPKGVAAEIKTQPGEKVQIESKRGSIVSRNADPDNAAILVERHGDGNNQDVVKRQSELTKIGEAEKDSDADADATGDEEEEEVGGGGKEEENYEEEQKQPVAGEKRDREIAEHAQTEKAGNEGAKGAAEKPIEEAKNDKEPGAKKAKLGEEGGAKDKEPDKEAATAEPVPPPPTKSGRGKGRARAKTGATHKTDPTPRRASVRTKKSTGSQANAAPGGGEGDKVEGVVGGVQEVIMAENVSEAPGEIEQSAKVAPAGHTRSKDLKAGAESHN